MEKWVGGRLTQNVHLFCFVVVQTGRCCTRRSDAPAFRIMAPAPDRQIVWRLELRGGADESQMRGGRGGMKAAGGRGKMSRGGRGGGSSSGQSRVNSQSLPHTTVHQMGATRSAQWSNFPDARAQGAAHLGVGKNDPLLPPPAIPGLRWSEDSHVLPHAEQGQWRDQGGTGTNYASSGADYASQLQYDGAMQQHMQTMGHHAYAKQVDLPTVCMQRRVWVGLCAPCRSSPPCDSFSLCHFLCLQNFAEAQQHLHSQPRSTYVSAQHTRQMQQMQQGTSFAPSYQPARQQQQQQTHTQPAPRGALMLEVGSWMSLVSRSDLRYEGQLVAISREHSTVELSSVRCFGDEGRRRGDSAVRPSDQIFERIVFRSQDIKDMHVLNAFPAGLTRDPAIVAYQVGGGAGSAAPGKSAPAPAPVQTKQPPREASGDQAAAAPSVAQAVPAAPVRRAAAWSNPADSVRLIAGGGVGNVAATKTTTEDEVDNQDWLKQEGGKGLRPLEVEKLAEASGSVVSKDTQHYNASRSFFDTISRDCDAPIERVPRAQAQEREMDTFGTIWRGLPHRGRFRPRHATTGRSNAHNISRPAAPPHSIARRGYLGGGNWRGSHSTYPLGSQRGAHARGRGQQQPQQPPPQQQQQQRRGRAHVDVSVPNAGSSAGGGGGKAGPQA